MGCMVVKVNMTSINANQLESRVRFPSRPHETLSLKAGQNLSRTSFSRKSLVFNLRKRVLERSLVRSYTLYSSHCSQSILCKLEGFPDSIFQ